MLQTWKRHFEYQDFEKIFPRSKAEGEKRDTPNRESGFQVSDYSLKFSTERPVAICQLHSTSGYPINYL